ncbi:MAG: TldD/PmbA family protein [Lachnospiraceae bacterium]|jgi:TldD protein|nr:TldD/PmbA family protein [Lachnospiraceae bacterium]
MISKEEMQQVLDYAQAKGAEFSELFLEDRSDQEVQCAKQQIQGIKNLRIYGAGLRLLQGTQEVYTYSSEVSLRGLMTLAEEALALLAGGAESKGKGKALKRMEGVNPNPVRLEVNASGVQKKIRIAKAAERAATGAGVPLLSQRVVYSDTDQRVWIANSEGVLAADRRVSTRARVYYTVGDEKGGLYEWADFVKPCGMEAWETDEWELFIRERLRSSYASLKAEPLKSGNMPVVLEAGDCGALWHECCGHTLEAAAIAAGSSDFIGRLGQQVASSKVALIDDGTLPGLYGSSAFDDEGHPRQRNILIEKGVLKTYLCDRLHGQMIGMRSNGCGRRQDYTYAPTSRMSNTYLAPGTDDEEEMIRSLGEGLYVKRLGGGSGGQIFSLICREAYLIKNGQIDRPVRNCMITGNGMEVMKKIDRVGSKIETEYGSFCGAASGLVNVTSFQPRVRIAEMIVGGEG